MTMVNTTSPSECLEVPGYKFWIEIAGKQVKQYKLERDDRVISCYIASEVNQEFTIVGEKYQNGFAAQAQFYLNDDCVRRSLFKHKDKAKREISYIRTEEGKQKFAFSSINYADDCDDDTDLASAPKNLGTIRVELFRVKDVRRVRAKPEKANKSSAASDLGAKNLRGTPTMSEKSKTVGFHTISLRPPETPSTSTSTPNHDHSTGFVTNFHYVDSDPWYTIKFFYRPLDILRAQEIIPPLPAPEDIHDRKNNQEVEQSSLSQKTPERKPLISPKKTQAQVHKADKTKQMKPVETILIEASDHEDHKSFSRSFNPGVKPKQSTSSKRPRESYDTQPDSKKRVKRPSKPVVIVIDSD